MVSDSIASMSVPADTEGVCRAADNTGDHWELVRRARLAQPRTERLRPRQASPRGVLQLLAQRRGIIRVIPDIAIAPWGAAHREGPVVARTDTRWHGSARPMRVHKRASARGVHSPVQPTAGTAFSGMLPPPLRRRSRPSPVCSSRNQTSQLSSAPFETIQPTLQRPFGVQVARAISTAEISARVISSSWRLTRTTSMDPMTAQCRTSRTASAASGIRTRDMRGNPRRSYSPAMAHSPGNDL
jgi:hypothetical protein